MGFRAYDSKGVDKNGAKCNMGFGRRTKIYPFGCVTPSRKLATAEQFMTKCACPHRRRCNARTLEVKPKATEIQEDVAIHRERTRRITNEHARAEGHVNDGIGSLGKALQAAARRTQSDVWRTGPRKQLEGGDGAH